MKKGLYITLFLLLFLTSCGAKTKQLLYNPYFFADAKFVYDGYAVSGKIINDKNGNFTFEIKKPDNLSGIKVILSKGECVVKSGEVKTELTVIDDSMIGKIKEVYECVLSKSTFETVKSETENSIVCCEKNTEIELDKNSGLPLSVKIGNKKFEGVFYNPEKIN